MKLWLISQDVNTGYDTYDSAVVAAETAWDAKNISPSGHLFHRGEWGWWGVTGNFIPTSLFYSAWAAPRNVRAKCIGTASPGTERGVIIASFNAG